MTKDVKDVEPPIAQYLPDIRIPLIAPRPDLKKIRGIREKNLFCLHNYLGDAYSGGRKAVRAFQEEHPEAFSGIRTVTGHCINLFTGHKFDVPQDQETFDMKTLAEEWREEILEEGRVEGMETARREGILAMIQTGREWHHDDQQIASALVQKYKLSPQEAQDYLVQA